MTGNYFYLAVIWICWCVLHSLLISETVTGYLQRCMGRLFCFYRFLYNLFAVVSLVLPISYSVFMQLSEVPVFVWEGGLGYVRWMILLIVLVLFFGGARSYDLSYFLGLSQMRTASVKQHFTVFKTTGILTIVRHPWYAGAILFVWTGLKVMSLSSILTAGIISSYFLVGVVLEERKLANHYGATYRSYQQEVSMLFPWKWLCRKIKKLKNEV